MIAGFVAAMAWGGGGATISVPGDAESIAGALTLARDGDTIALAAGVWAAPGYVERSVTIVGVDGPEVTTITGLFTTALESYATSLTLDGVTFEIGGWAGDGAIVAFGGLTLSDVHVVSAGGGYDGATGVIAWGPLTLTDVSFGGSFGGAALVAAGGGVGMDRVTVSVSDARLPAFDLYYGAVVANDLHFAAGPGYGDLVSTYGAESVEMTRVSACVPGSLTLDAGRIELDAVHLPIAGHPTLFLTGQATVRHATLAGDVEGGGSLALWSSALLGGATVKGATGGGYDLFEGSDAPDVLALGSIQVEDAGFVSTEGDQADQDGGNGACMAAPGAGSPAIDAGDPATFDRNATRADIGATGGAHGFVVDVDRDGWTSDVDCADTDGASHPGADEVPYDGLDQDCDGADLWDVDGDGSPWPTDCDDDDPTVTADCDPDTVPTVPLDVDGDGVSADLDCDDADPTVFPGAVEDLGPADLDCDGFSDPATPFERAACSSSAGSPSGGLLVVGLVLLASRRRSHA